MIRNDIKPALMAAIEGEFAKNPKSTDYTPVRTSRADAAKKAAGAKQAGQCRGMLNAQCSTLNAQCSAKKEARGKKQVCAGECSMHRQFFGGALIQLCVCSMHQQKRQQGPSKQV